MPLKFPVAQNWLRGTFDYCICLVMIGLLLLGVVNSIRLRLYLRALGQACLCGNVGSDRYISKMWKCSPKQYAAVIALLLSVGMVPMMNFTIYGETVMTITIMNLVQFAALLRKLKVTPLQSMVKILLNILMLHNYMPNTILFYILSSCSA